MRLAVAFALGGVLMWTAQLPAGAAPAEQAGAGELIEDSQPGENIAAGDPTAAEVVAGWMSSSRRRANILNAEFREIGVGVLTGAGEFGIYWVQMFGTRQG